jgi:hypothetical protein
MPASLVLSAIYGDMILAGAALGATGVAAASFAINVVATVALNSLLVKQPELPGEQGQMGGRVQLPAATNNKLPVVYGDAWVSPIIVDARISDDQQMMTYVLALCESTDTGTISFGNVYWDDKRLLFDPANPTDIWGWFIEGNSEEAEDNTIITGVAGRISMAFYGNGSANLGTTHHCISQSYVGSEQPTTFPAWEAVPGWDSTYTMDKTVFVVVQVEYDQDHGVTGLGQLRFNVKNTLKQPGSVMLDYLQNDRYGCGVDVTNINTSAFTALDTYSATELSIGDITLADRYQINGVVETSRDCLSNLIIMADSCDSWVQWNEQLGQWGVLMNRSFTESGGNTSTMRVFTSDSIIGGIQISPLDLNSTYNAVNVQFPNYTIQDQSDFRLLEIDAEDRSPYEPNNQLSLNLPLVNNDGQATYIGWKRLYASRNDIIINFTTDFSGIQVDAGEIIAVKHDWYGFTAGNYGGIAYPGKPFRVTQIREIKSTDGSLGAQITAIAYNEQDYSPGEHYSTVRNFSGYTDPEYISKPPAPTIPEDLKFPDKGNFVVECQIPEYGNTLEVELWYSSNGSAFDENNYVLFGIQNYSEGPVYPKVDENDDPFFEQFRLENVPTGNYYFRSRARGENTVSEFSEPSSVINWTLTGVAISGTQIEDGSLTGSKIATGDPQKTGTSQSGGFFDTLGPIGTAALVGAAGYGLYKTGILNDIIPKDFSLFGGGNDAGITDTAPNVIQRFFDPNGQRTEVAQVGGTQEIIMDQGRYDGYARDIAQNEDNGLGGFLDGDWGGWSDFG